MASVTERLNDKINELENEVARLAAEKENAAYRDE